jgi:heme-degrading monooxygenase HmoA
MTGGLRVLVFYREPADDPGAVQRAYHGVSAEMAGTAGLLANQLLRDVMDPTSYLVAADWVDLAAFQAWDVSTGHRRTTPLDPYQELDPSKRLSFGIFEVVASYPAVAPALSDATSISGEAHRN